MMEQVDKYDAFVSYSHAETPEVKKLVKRLENLGGDLHIWHDREAMELGEKWLDQIDEALRSVPCCLVCIGDKAPDGTFDEEIKIAFDLAKAEKLKVIPVVLPGGSTDNVKGWLRSRTIVNLDSQYTENVRKIHKSLLALRDPSKPKDPPPSVSDEKGLRKTLKAIRDFAEEGLIKKVAADDICEETVRAWAQRAAQIR